jgi:flagellin
MADISLSKAVRSNLISLKTTADMMVSTQNRLATGNKVNSALDNPSSWFTAKGLSNRAGDLNSLLDSMANGVKTLEAADNGLSSMTKTLESMQSTLRQARQDKSFQTESYTLDTKAISEDITSAALADASKLTFRGGAFGEDTEVDLGLVKGAAATATIGIAAATFDLDEAADGLNFSINVNGGGATAVTIRGSAAADTITVDAGTETFTMNVANGAAVTTEELAKALNGGFAAENIEVKVGVDADNKLTFTGPVAEDHNEASIDLTVGVIQNGTTGTALTLGNFGFAATDATEVTTKEYAVKTVDELVASINASNSEFAGKIRASNDNGKLRIENQSTQKLEIDGVSAMGAVDGTTADAADILGNSVRVGLSQQFNELRDQLDKIADDASFNGINLLRGDKLSITFNETGTSSIDIQTENGETVNSANLQVSTTLEETSMDSDATIDAELGRLKAALNDVRSQASSFGSNLSIVENRQAFTKAMINTLEDGAGNLTLADMNTEAANLLALQTRQSLSQNSLSLASQADQSILQLIR